MGIRSWPLGRSNGTAPATVGGERRANCHWGSPGRPRKHRPVSQETCRHEQQRELGGVAQEGVDMATPDRAHARILISSLALAAYLGFSGQAAAQTTYPLTLQNCGVDIRFDAAPDSVVAVGQAVTEILYSLDLQDKVAGTAVWFTDVLPQFATANAEVERLADNDPSFESVVAKRPGLVAAQYECMSGRRASLRPANNSPVSYTHLTLPTIYSV